MNIILGGFDSVASLFPHLTTTIEGDDEEVSDSVSEASTVPAEDANDDGMSSITIPWMPTMVFENRVFLGRREQVEDIRVLKCLNITHVLSIGRYQSMDLILLLSFYD